VFLKGIVPGLVVLLVTPENPRLHKTRAVVVEVSEWGAHVKSEASATGKFRALFQEMTPLEESNGTCTTKKNRELGYTGNVCDSCGSIKMVRSGTCEVCQECGRTSGCG
jgi:hypothetical protein